MRYRRINATLRWEEIPYTTLSIDIEDKEGFTILEWLDLCGLMADTVARRMEQARKNMETGRETMKWERESKKEQFRDEFVGPLGNDWLDK